MLIEGFYSLLFPDAGAQARHFSGQSVPDVSEDVIEEIGLSDYLSVRSAKLTEFLSVEPETIRFRQKVFSDLTQTPEIAETLISVFPILNDIMELRRLDLRKEETTEDYLTSITEIELYISCVEKLHDGFEDKRDRVTSEALLRLMDTITTLSESDYYRELNEKLDELTSRVREIRSVTIGVNLDSQLQPKDAGVLSLNAEEFKSGDLLEKILRFRFKDDAYTCIAPLVPFLRGQSENRQEALYHAFHSAINDVFKSSVKEWKKIVSTYVLENTDFLLQLMPEIEFLVKGTRFLNRIAETGMPVSYPELSEDGSIENAFHAAALWNPDVALRSSTDPVANDFSFDSNGSFFILTGPNRGGKSVFTCAVGIAQLMAQFGMPVAAGSMTVRPVRAVFTHFPSGSEDTIDKGRLGEECSRLEGILSRSGPDCLVLLDESLSSTGAYEASYIAAELVASFAAIGCRGIFATHLHELAAQIGEINDRVRPYGRLVDSLVAEMQDGERSFRILRKNPDGRSYARDIADRYGISFDRIITSRKEETGVQN